MELFILFEVLLLITASFRNLISSLFESTNFDNENGIFCCIFLSNEFDGKPKYNKSFFFGPFIFCFINLFYSLLYGILFISLYVEFLCLLIYFLLTTSSLLKELIFNLLEVLLSKSLLKLELFFYLKVKI